MLAWALLQGACTTPTERLRSVAAEQGFERRSVAADGFHLTIFENGAYAAVPALPAARPPHVAPDPPALSLNVYLEGDGSPWRYRVFVMRDPTPRQPLMLRLMALDAAPAIYVGRPCYNGTSLEAGCHDALWTSDRYSPLVVDSMARSIERIAARRGVTAIRLFGHSGGGALALLLAERLPAVTDVVTVAGNLDTEAWTRHHGYTPLYGSLNPAARAPLADDVRQWHLLGGRDTVVPPALVRPWIHSQTQAVGVLFDSFTHGCCWQRVWPGVLRAVERDAPELLPGRVFQMPLPGAPALQSPSAASSRAG